MNGLETTWFNTSMALRWCLFSALSFGHLLTAALSPTSAPVSRTESRVELQVFSTKALCTALCRVDRAVSFVVLS